MTDIKQDNCHEQIRRARPYLALQALEEYMPPDHEDVLTALGDVEGTTLEVANVTYQHVNTQDLADLGALYLALTVRYRRETRETTNGGGLPAELV